MVCLIVFFFFAVFHTFSILFLVIIMCTRVCHILRVCSFIFMGGSFIVLAKCLYAFLILKPFLFEFHMLISYFLKLVRIKFFYNFFLVGLSIGVRYLSEVFSTQSPRFSSQNCSGLTFILFLRRKHLFIRFP